MLQRCVFIAWLALEIADAIRDPLDSFAKAGHSWPALPCRTFAGTGPATSDGKFIYTTTDTDVVVWNDVSCSSSRAAADLQVTRAFREEMDAMAFLPPKTIVVASKSLWQGFHGIYYSRLRFYNVGNVGTSAEPMFARRFDGQITSLLVIGDDLLISAIWTYKEEHYIHGLFNALSEPTVDSVKVKTPEPLRKLLAFEDRVMGVSERRIFLWPRQELFAGETPISWRVPCSNISEWSVTIQDICLVHPQYLAVAANPANGFGGGSTLYVLDLRKAIKDGSFDSAELMSQRSLTNFRCLATISDLGFAVGTTNRTVDLYQTSALKTTQQPYKQLRVVSSWPTKLGFLHGAYLAVGTADNQVQTFGLKRLLNGKSAGQPTMILPIESRVVDFLALPGSGLAVAGLHHVLFFSSSATQINANSARLASFGSLRDCLDAHGLTGLTGVVQPLADKQVAVAVSDIEDQSLILCKLHRPNIYKPNGYTKLVHSFANTILELPQANLLAVGMTNRLLVLYNISETSQTQSSDQNLEAITSLETNLMATSLASQETTLMAGTQNRIYVWRTQDFRTWRLVQRRKHDGTVWDLVFLNNGLVAAAGDFEAVTLYSYDTRLTMVKSLAVKGPAFSMTPLNGALLVATEFFIHLFQDALDPKKEVNTSIAELAVNGVNSPPPANSISIVGDALLVGLELYRPSNSDGRCAQGTFSAPGDFQCHECPAGWTSYGAAGSCDYPAAETLLLLLQIVIITILVGVLALPKLLVVLLKLPKVCVSGPPATPNRKREKAIAAALPYALLVTIPGYALLFSGYAVMALAPLLVTLWAAWPGVPWGLGQMTLGSLAASSLVCAIFVICSSVLSSAWGLFANLMLFSCNAYFTLHLRRWLHHSFVNTQDGIKANTAGIRALNVVFALLYAGASAFSIVTLAQHPGHAVWTPLGTADARHGVLPIYLMAISSFFALMSVGFAAKACLEAEELHQTASLWARDEKVPPSRLPRHFRFQLLLRVSVLCKSWRSRHLLFMASALYDSFIFYRGLQHSRRALSSQFYDFAVILTFGIGTASLNALALVLDHFHVRLPEMGDRNFRLSSLCKSILLFLKLRVLKVPLVVIAHMDTSWLSDQSLLGEGEHIPIWICSDKLTCRSRCRNDLNGNCTYTSQPAYIGCYCEYLTAGIPVTSDRLMVFGNCLISAFIIALLTNSRMRTRGLFRYPELSLFALGCVTFLPTAFITVNTVYLSVPQLAKLHVNSWQDFLVLTIPALVFIIMANEMARRIETAWKLRYLNGKDKVKLQCSEGVWQVISTDGVEHLLGCRVEAVDAEGRSLLLAKEGRHVTVQGPAVLLFKDPPRYGSLWVSSGFRALTPLAHVTTLGAIVLVWERLFQGVIFFDVLTLLVLSFASGILNFTLLDEEIRILPRSASISLTNQNLMSDGSFSQTLSENVAALEVQRAHSEPPLLEGHRTFNERPDHWTPNSDRDPADLAHLVELQPTRKDLENQEPRFQHSNTS